MASAPHHRRVRSGIRDNAKHMRRQPTDAESAMWRLLRNRRLTGLKFRRQVPFRGCILDFVCFDRKLVIEIDGSQHLGSARDEVRDAVLDAEGFVIVRYWNNDVQQRSRSVLEDLLERIARLTPAAAVVGDSASP
ncbi:MULTISPECIES: endonuclease domain-containing protein [Rhodoplanes]|nr:endonuclease domain-containing protein [Rhodoplanes serenus]